MFVINTDDRITKDIIYCLYCYTIQGYDGSASSLASIIHNHNIKLISLVDNIKQCPKCQRIYILG